MLTTAINHGIVIDSQNKTKKQLHVGIQGDKIAVLSETPLEAEEVIDAGGLVVSPGFIDPHGHVDGELYAGELSVCQGITTTVGGNCGYSPEDMGEFFREQERKGFPIHQAMLIGHGIPLRNRAGVYDRYKPACDEEIEIMKETARKAFQDGACGVSFGLDYVPGCSIREVVELARLCAEYGKICPIHTRLLTNEDLYSLYELILVARETKADILISHFVYQYCGGLCDPGLKMLEKAQKEGLNIHIDSGMYTNWTTYFDTATFDLNNIQNNNWKFSQMVVATGKYKGQVMDEELYFRMKEECPHEAVIFFEGIEDEIYECLKKPYAMPSTDIGAYDKGEGHPQIAGTYPRYFREMVRERKLLTLEEAVHKATYLPAKVFKMEDKGVILPGKDADITVFDPAEICDTATYPHMGLPDARPRGIPYVLVAGETAVKEGIYTGSRSGRPIRK